MPHTRRQRTTRRYRHQSFALTRKERFAFAGVGLTVLGIGVLDLFAGRLFYISWIKQPVFAPFAVLVGLLVLYMALSRRA